MTVFGKIPNELFLFSGQRDVCAKRKRDSAQPQDVTVT
jgi:hypothetical protein